MARKVRTFEYIQHQQSKIPAEKIAKSLGCNRLKAAHFRDETPVLVDDDWNLVDELEDEKEPEPEDLVAPIEPADEE